MVCDASTFTRRCFGQLLQENAHRELIPEAIHDTSQYANNRLEQSHEATRVRERGMRRFKSVRQAQRFATAHAVQPGKASCKGSALS